MSGAKAVKLMLLGAITTMPEEEQKKFKIASDAIRKIAEEHGQAGVLAVTLVAMEYGEQQEGEEDGH